MASQQVTGNIGMYYAAYRLSRMGWNVMPTSRNARGIDLLIYDSGGHYQGIQVKALSKLKSPVPLGKTTNKLVGDWWIIVTMAATDNPECFVMKPEEVARLAHRGVKDSRVSYWLQPRNYHTGEFREAWRRIGSGVVASASSEEEEPVTTSTT